MHREELLRASKSERNGDTELERTCPRALRVARRTARDQPVRPTVDRRNAVWRRSWHPAGTRQHRATRSSLAHPVLFLGEVGTGKRAQRAAAACLHLSGRRIVRATKRRAAATARAKAQRVACAVECPGHGRTQRVRARAGGHLAGVASSNCQAIARARPAVPLDGVISAATRACLPRRLAQVGSGLRLLGHNRAAEPA